jgi:hypothetical protein
LEYFYCWPDAWLYSEAVPRKRDAATGVAALIVLSTRFHAAQSERAACSSSHSATSTPMKLVPGANDVPVLT